MGLIDIRELLPFPAGSSGNETDTVINGVHFNLTALQHWNYTIYTNGTISNESRCFLIFDQYQPSMLSNGSWINGTSCYFPYYGIGTRGQLSIAFAVLFAVTIMFTLINLRKHGKMYIKESRRFRIVGRRWQWYWMSFVAACGIISTITGVDVDRNYLQGLAIVLQSFFFTLMMPGTLAMVWECVRHWGSWQERQIYDRDPYVLPDNDRRSKTEFWLPLVFYLLAWLNFFTTIPRSWSTLQLQRSREQQEAEAEPSGTDNRLKAGALLAASAWFVIFYSLSHSLHHYKPRTTGLLWGFDKFFHHCPLKLLLILICLALRIGYAILSAWAWQTTLFKYDVMPAWPFALGYGSTLLLLIILNVFGYLEENEDKLLIQQRAEWGRAADADLGITPKPQWWSKLRGGPNLTPEQRLRALTTEVQPGRPNEQGVEGNVELRNMQPQNSTLRNRSKNRGPSDRVQHSADITVSSDEASESNSIGGTTLNEVRQQKVRSMLDV